MPEPIKRNIEQQARNLEQRINQLAGEVKQILESPEGKGMEEKEALRQALRPKIYPPSAGGTGGQTGPAAAAPARKSVKIPDYLEAAPPEIKRQVARFVDLAFEEGIEKAASQARKEPPLILDAFHDVLIDKLYQELKARQIIK